MGTFFQIFTMTLFFMSVGTAVESKKEGSGFEKIIFDKEQAVFALVLKEKFEPKDLNSLYFKKVKYLFIKTNLSLGFSCTTINTQRGGLGFICKNEKILNVYTFKDSGYNYFCITNDGTETILFRTKESDVLQFEEYLLLLEELQAKKSKKLPWGAFFIISSATPHESLDKLGIIRGRHCSKF